MIQLVLVLIALGFLSLGIAHVVVGLMKSQTMELLSWQKIVIYIQLAIEIFVFWQTSSMILNLSRSLNYDATTIVAKPLQDYPPIDVFVPIRRVDPNILEKTLNSLRYQEYPNGVVKIFIADDTPEMDLVGKYKELADKYGAVHLHDPSNTKYKAGMLNIAMKEAQSEYIAFFDYDQVPTPGILSHLVSILESNPDVSYVQAKKAFRDLYNLTRLWSALLYVQLFEVLEKFKHLQNTVMFAGSTACFRRQAIDMVGGLPEDTFTEDNGLTVRLLTKGHSGIFTSRTGSVGTVPYGFPAQISQLWRWSHGGVHVLRNQLSSVIRSRSMKMGQKLDTIATFSITITTVFIYLYTLSFIPLILTGIDSPRINFFGTNGVSTLIYIALAPAFTYLLIAVFALYSIDSDEKSEFKLKNLVGFLIIALSSNILILQSGLAAILGVYGPNSRKGAWTRDVPIWRIASIGFIIGLMVEVASIIWMIQGYSSAIVLLLIGFTLLPTLPIVFYYTRENRY